MKQMNKKRQQCILHFDRKKMWKIQWKYEMECFVHWLIRGKRHFKSYALSSESPGTDNIFIKFEATTFLLLLLLLLLLFFFYYEKKLNEKKKKKKLPTKWQSDPPSVTQSLSVVLQQKAMWLHKHVLIFCAMCNNVNVCARTDKMPKQKHRHKPPPIGIPVTHTFDSILGPTI